MFKKIVLSAALASAMFATSGLASSNVQGGFVGKSAMSASTVKQALTLPDDARVVIEGSSLIKTATRSKSRSTKMTGEV